MSSSARAALPVVLSALLGMAWLLQVSPAAAQIGTSPGRILTPKTTGPQQAAPPGTAPPAGAAPAPAGAPPPSPPAAIPTLDAEHVAKRLYLDERQVSCAAGAYSCGSVHFAAVPAGKRLIVEHVWVRADMPAGQAPLVNLFAGRNLSILLTQQVNYFGNMVYVGGGPMRFYVDSGGVFMLTAGRNATSGTALIGMTVSGQLIDVP